MQTFKADTPETATELVRRNFTPKVLPTPKVAKTPVKKKKVGVVGISKAENVQLGLLLRWVALDLDWDTIPNDVLRNPEALTKLIGRYKEQS